MKKIVKSAVSLFLLTLIVMGSLLACSDNTQTETTTANTTAAVNTTPESTVPETESIYDANGYLKDKLGNFDFKDRTVTVFCWSGDTLTEEFCTDGLTGEVINDSNYNRNLTVEERCKIKFDIIREVGGSKTTNQTIYLTKLKGFLNTGDTTVDLIGAYSMVGGELAVDGLCYDLKTCDVYEWDMPWWPNGIVESSQINGKLYSVSGDISLNNTVAMQCMFFNKTILEEHNLEDPYKLVSDNKWTIDKMWEMCKGLYEDTNKDGAVNAGDKTGFLFREPAVDTFLMGGGIRILTTVDGQLQLNPDFVGERGEAVISKLAAFAADKTAVIFNNSTTDFGDGLDLFYSSAASTAMTLNNTEVKFGMLCLPKVLEDQADYYTPTTWQYTLFSIPYNCTDVECISTVMEVLASESYRTAVPALYENALKCRYVQDENASAMFDFMRSKLMYDSGRVFAVDLGYPGNAVRGIVGNGGSWSAVAKGSKKGWENALKNILKSFE